MFIRNFSFVAVVCSSLVVMFPAAEAAAQSGWTKSQGTYFTKLDYTRFAASAYYNASGTQLQTNTFRQTGFNFYGEYGLSDQWNILASMPLLRVNSFEGTEKVYGNGDLRLELKYRPLKSIPLSVSIGPEIPIGRRNAFASSKDNPDERINLPTGDGEFNVWTTIAGSHSINSKVYVSAFGSYNFRTQFDGMQFVDLYQIGGEIGFSPLEKLWLNAKIRGQFALGESTHPALGFVRGDGTTYTLISAEAFYRLRDGFGISAAYLTGNEWLAEFKNIYIAPYFSIGVTFEKL